MLEPLFSLSFNEAAKAVKIFIKSSSPTCLSLILNQHISTSTSAFLNVGMLAGPWNHRLIVIFTLSC